MRKGREEGNAIRSSDFGGTSHAGEYETALYLALAEELVQMDKAVDERSPLSPSFQTDLLMGKREDGSVANLWPYWSSLTDSGVLGDATAATRAKGEQFLEAAVEGLIELVREFRTVAVNPRKDHISPDAGDQ